MKASKAITLFKKAPLALALAGVMGSAHAVEFNFGEVKVQFDNTVSYGVAVRTESPDMAQVMPDNVGAGSSTGSTSHGSSYNYDDGTLNYKKGDVYSSVFKWNGDLEVGYKNFGAFVRARAWYDFAIMDQATDFKPIPKQARNYAGNEAEILDAFVWGDFVAGNTPINLRVGKQVVNWGESTFIQGGINSINPVDAMAFRRPGAEIKEGLLPVNMVFASIGLTDSTTLEAFYQLEWAETRVDPCGTFFSTIDFVYEGCGNVVIGSGFNEVDTPESARPASVVERMSDDKPRDDGQFGIALRSYIGGTEFGAYYMNIHSRMPYISGMVGTPGGLSNIVYSGADKANPAFQIAYPEDIQIMGLSFSTGLPNGASLGGEISYRPDTPVQWNAFELILGGLQVPWSRMWQDRAASLGYDTSTIDSSNWLFNTGFTQDMAGQVMEGWDELDVWQAQMTYIQFFDRVLGADRLAMAIEAGVTHVADLPSKDKARYGRSGAYGIGNNQGVQGDVPTDMCGAATNPYAFGSNNTTRNSNTNYCSDEGYVTEWSGGVRLRAGLDYSNVFAGVNVTPNIMLSYDKGYGPEPGAQFIDDRFVYSVGASFVYQNNASLDLSYTGFQVGKYDQMGDRDNVQLAVKYSF